MNDNQKIDGSRSPGAVPGNPVDGSSKPIDLEPVSLSTPSTTRPVEITPEMAQKAFDERVEANTEAAGGCLDIISGVPYKLCAWKASGFIEKKSDIDDVLQPLKPSTKSQNAASGALARIFARRSQNSEALDIAVLVGYSAELATGTALVLMRLDKMEKRLTKQDEKEKE